MSNPSGELSQSGQSGQVAEVVVHHLQRSRSQRIAWLLEELEVPYQVKVYARDPKTQRAPASLRAVHPLGRAPVVEVGGRVLAESGAIIEALLDRFGAGRLRPKPDDVDAVEAYRYWLHYAEGSLMPPLLVQFINDQIGGAPVPFFIKPLTRGLARALSAAYAGPEVKNHIQFLEGALAQRVWLAGDGLTGADVQMSFPLEMLLALTADAKRWPPTPHIRAYVERLQARTAYQRARARMDEAP